jgi:hypothetical protein
VAV